METMEAAAGITFKAIGPGGLWVAPLSPHLCSHSPPRCNADKLTYGKQLWVYTPDAIEEF